MLRMDLTFAEPASSIKYVKLVQYYVSCVNQGSQYHRPQQHVCLTIPGATGRFVLKVVHCFVAQLSTKWSVLGIVVELYPSIMFQVSCHSLLIL